MEKGEGTAVAGRVEFAASGLESANIVHCDFVTLLGVILAIAGLTQSDAISSRGAEAVPR